VGHTDTLACNDPGNENFWTCTAPNSFSSIESVFRDQGAGWHYCLFAHRYDDGDGDGSSGKSNGWNTFIVTLGGWTDQIGTPWDRTGTFVHELGHDLGLGHQAPNTPLLGSGPYAPNLASVMSYQYQVRGVRTRLECLGLVGAEHLYKNLDYSHGRMAPLHELFLSEPVGVGIHAVDWDCNDLIEPDNKVRELDIDDGDANWCNAGGGLGTVYDYDEWSNIVDSSDDAGLLDGSRMARSYDCITFEEARAMEDAPGSCPSAQPDPSVVEPEPSGKMIWVDPANQGSQLGNGEFPYAYLFWADLFAPAGSILYLQPGIHTDALGDPILLTKPLILTGPGGAVIIP